MVLSHSCANKFILPDLNISLAMNFENNNIEIIFKIFEDNEVMLWLCFSEEIRRKINNPCKPNVQFVLLVFICRLPYAVLLTGRASALWVIRLMRLRFRSTKNWAVNKLSFFITASNIHHQISVILSKPVYFYNLCNNDCSWMFENKVIDRFMHCIMKNFKIKYM